MYTWSTTLLPPEKKEATLLSLVSGELFGELQFTDFTLARNSPMQLTNS